MSKKIILFFIVNFIFAFHFPAAYTENLFVTANQAGSFKVFLGAIKTAGLSQKLADGGPYTIFAPDDHAFSRLPEAEWAALAKDKLRLARLLNYHIIKGRVKITEIKPGNVASLEGDLLKLKSDNGLVTINGIRVTQSDLFADNGIIHVIDNVLIPPD